MAIYVIVIIVSIAFIAIIALANVNQVPPVIVIVIAFTVLLPDIIINDSVIITPSVSCPHVSQKIEMAVYI